MTILGDKKITLGNQLFENDFFLSKTHFGGLTDFIKLEGFPKVIIGLRHPLKNFKGKEIRALRDARIEVNFI